MIHWLGHSSVKITGSKIVYFDPWEISGEKADIILISHSHRDHCSLEDVKKIHKHDTVIIASSDCVAKLGPSIISLAPGEKWQSGKVIVEAVPAYNIGKKFHPKDNNWVGYILTLDGKRYYHAGDTDKIPEMNGISVDVAFLPVGGTYTMNFEEAASACLEMKIKEVIPIHYGKVVGSGDDAIKFKELCKSKVKILNKE